MCAPGSSLREVRYLPCAALNAYTSLHFSLALALALLWDTCSPSASLKKPRHSPPSSTHHPPTSSSPSTTIKLSEAPRPYYSEQPIITKWRASPARYLHCAPSKYKDHSRDLILAHSTIPVCVAVFLMDRHQELIAFPDTTSRAPSRLSSAQALRKNSSPFTPRS